MSEKHIPPEKRTSRKAQLNADSLLQAALESFSNNGFDGASLRKIARSAGVGFQLIDYYFGSKEALWQAAVEHANDDYHEQARKITLSAGPDAMAQFRKGLHDKLSLANREPYLSRMYFQEKLSGSERFHTVLLPLRNRFYKTVAIPFFRKAVDYGLVTRFTPRECALMTANMILVNAVDIESSRFFLSRQKSDTIINSQVELLCKALCAPQLLSAGIKSETD